MFAERWYQTEAFNSVVDYFMSGKPGNPIVAMPTGTGKSIVIPRVIMWALRAFPYTRVMMLTHVQELIEQNAEKMRAMWPQVPMGICSAGMGRYDYMQPVIFGGCKTVRNIIEKFGVIHIVIVDECHLMNDEEETTYMEIINELKKKNPHLRVIGFTATYWRSAMGLLTNGRIFDDICYNLCTPESFSRLIGEGYLAPLIPKRTHTQIDVSSVGRVGADFNQSQLQKAVDIDEQNVRALQELCYYGQNRNSWLIFAAGNEHAEHLSGILNSWGVQASFVHSRIGKVARKERIDAFKSGELRAMVNNNVLTTGFDHPAIDLIGMLRPTKSSSLWVQMLGRGTRPYPQGQKRNCLVLDYVGNTKNLGPIDCPFIPKQKDKGVEGDAPVKVCPKCSTYNYASVRYCCECGYTFEFQRTIENEASNRELLSSFESQEEKIERYRIDHIVYSKYLKNGRAPMLKVTYFSGLKNFSKMVCLEDKGAARNYAVAWWRGICSLPVAATVDEALQVTDHFLRPSTMDVSISGQYPQIIGFGYE